MYDFDSMILYFLKLKQIVIILCLTTEQKMPLQLSKFSLIILSYAQLVQSADLHGKKKRWSKLLKYSMPSKSSADTNKKTSSSKDRKSLKDKGHDFVVFLTERRAVSESRFRVMDRLGNPTYLGKQLQRIWNIVAVFQLLTFTPQESRIKQAISNPGFLLLIPPASQRCLQLLLSLCQIPPLPSLSFSGCRSDSFSRVNLFSVWRERFLHKIASFYPISSFLIIIFFFLHNLGAKFSRRIFSLYMSDLSTLCCLCASRMYF